MLAEITFKSWSLTSGVPFLGSEFMLPWLSHPPGSSTLHFQINGPAFYFSERIPQKRLPCTATHSSICCLSAHALCLPCLCGSVPTPCPVSREVPLASLPILWIISTSSGPLLGPYTSLH
jgi:hypothetical protein